MASKFNVFTGEVEVDKTDWHKNKEGRFVEMDGKIYDSVKEVVVKDPLKRINEINDSAHVMCRQYMQMVFQASRIVKGATDHSDLIAILDRHKNVINTYEESL